MALKTSQNEEEEVRQQNNAYRRQQQFYSCRKRQKYCYFLPYLFLILNTYFLFYNRHFPGVFAQNISTSSNQTTVTRVGAGAAATVTTATTTTTKFVNSFSHVPLIINNYNSLSSMQQLQLQEQPLKTNTTVNSPKASEVPVATNNYNNSNNKNNNKNNNNNVTNYNNNLQNFIISNDNNSNDKPKVPTKTNNNNSNKNSNNPIGNLSNSYVNISRSIEPGIILPPEAAAAISSSSKSSSLSGSLLTNSASSPTVHGSSSFMQPPTSVFFANYNNQQNVLLLVKNLDRRLNSIRNVEMRVAAIQEIFDSMHFNSNNMPVNPMPSSNANGPSKNSNSNSSNNIDGHNTKRLNEYLEKDLQLFNKRLGRKLEKAKHVVMDLRDFLRYNISTVLLQRADYKEDDYFDIDFDSEIDDADGNESQDITSNSQSSAQQMHFYLSSVVETMQDASSLYNESPAETEKHNQHVEQEQEQQQSHYNKQQIQILNYLNNDAYSIDNAVEQKSHYNNSHYNSRSWEANGFIVDKLRNLKTSLMRNEVLDLVFNGRPATTTMGGNNPANNKLKFLGNHFKHIYFLSRSDHATSHNRDVYHKEYFRYLYVSAIKQKFILLLLDVGSVMNMDLFELTKTFVNNVLKLLSDTDMVSIITISNETQLMQLDEITNHNNETLNGLYRATRSHKDYILNYVNNNINIGKSMTDHALGFDEAFGHIQKLQNETLLSNENPIEFVYITRGLLANLSDAMHVLQVIANGQRQLLEPIIINTCAVVSDEKRIMYEKQFLTDIALQNFTKYDIKVDDWLASGGGGKLKDANMQMAGLNSYLAGKFFVFTKLRPNLLWSASIVIFDSLFEERYLQKSPDIHLPVADEDGSKDVLVSITHAIAPFGVVGVNLYLSDLIEDVCNYGMGSGSKPPQTLNKHETVYAFLIDHNGITIAHPAFPRPLGQTSNSFPVDIAFLENSTDFLEIRRKMLQENSGSVSTTVSRLLNKNTELLKRDYHWQSVLDIYILCLVSTRRKEGQASSSNANYFVSSNVGVTATFQSANKSNVQILTGLPLSLQRFTLKDNTAAASSNYPQQHYDFMPYVDLLYHRLDIMTALMGLQQGQQNQNQHQQQQPKICHYFRQMATMDSPTLFLSAGAFESPFSFLQNSRISAASTQARIAETIMAYLKDTTGLLANPGLRSQIRQEVNILYTAMQHLKKRHQDARGLLKNYIIRRYIATLNGVLQIYPGCLLSNDYDATRRPWFRKAMQQPGKIVTTEPYLDAGGAGYIVTIAHTIFEGKANALHSIERDQPVAIVALDVPYAFFYKMILDSTPLCQMKNIKCLLFENEGYLIAHPSMMEVSTATQNQRRPHEHLTHKESYLANDILNHKNLVRKLACANYQNRTLQRYYTFNTALSAGDIWTNVVHGERTKYAITTVRGSNIFAAVLNSTVDGGAFCPCSTIDRVCLNCNRMDQMDCECPCECPMDMDALFSSKIDSFEEDSQQGFMFRNYSSQYAYCEPASEEFVALPPITLNNEQTLTTCININCDVYGTQTECLAVMGCEWCQQDLDGNSFTPSFCTSQSTCFNGVLSSITPYGDLDDIDIIAAHGYNPGQKQGNYSAFGPVGGALIVLAIVIGFAIYCYRHNLDAHAQEQFYVDSMQEENYGLPLSRFNFDDCQAHDEPPINGGYDPSSGGAAARSLINPADISPYHVSTGSSYRRPPNGESDHGYSTMTPHEDSSDHQCFTLAEPLLLHDKRHSKSDTLSISTSISSPTNRNQTHIYPAPGYHSTKDSRHNITSPKKFQTSTTLLHGSSGGNITLSEQTVLPQQTVIAGDLATTTATVTSSPHSFLAPVTVHRHMETSES